MKQWHIDDNTFNSYLLNMYYIYKLIFFTYFLHVLLDLNGTFSFSLKYNYQFKLEIKHVFISRRSTFILYGQKNKTEYSFF